MQTRSSMELLYQYLGSWQTLPSWSRRFLWFEVSKSFRKRDVVSILCFSSVECELSLLLLHDTIWKLSSFRSTCVISAVRYAFNVSNTNDISCMYRFGILKPSFSRSQSWPSTLYLDNDGPVIILSIVETQVTVMCSALVVCQPVITFLMPRRFFKRISITRNATRDD